MRHRRPGAVTAPEVRPAPPTHRTKEPVMYRRFPGSIPPLTAAVLAAALLGCDGAGTSPPPRTQETSVATPPAVTPPAPPPLAQVPVMRTNTCDKDTFVG